MNYVVVQPHHTKTGVAIWGDGHLLVPICGSDKCLESNEAHCALSEAQDWVCSSCGRPHGIEGAERDTIVQSSPFVKEVLSAWIGVPPENIGIDSLT